MRKYTTEFNVQITVHVAWLGKQKHFAMKSLPDSPPCHLYVIGKRKKLSVHPDSVEFSQEKFSAKVRRQTGESREELSIGGLLNDRRFNGKVEDYRWESSYPYEEFRIVGSDSGLICGGEVALLLQSGHFLPPEWRSIEIVYIGQSMRQALERLGSHSTLQRIYSEAQPDEDVWIGLCSVTDVALHFTIDPTAKVATSDEQDDDHIQRVHSAMEDSSTFRKKGSIDLAEAALIAYFNPRYNVHFKGTFPDPKHASLAECYELDFHSLIVEFNATELGVPFGSEGRAAATTHFLRLPIFQHEGRIKYLEAFDVSMEKMTQRYEV
ncbi:hypothetical protein [Streptomyces nigrescens]